MKTETIGPTFRRVILLLAAAALGGGSVAAASRPEDPGPETSRRLVALETASARQQALLDQLDKRTERMDAKLDRLIERK